MATIIKSRKLAWEVTKETKKDKNWGEKNPLYYSSGWKRLRNMCLEKNPFCVKCLDGGKYVMATVADHIKPIRLGGEALDLDNLQGLCNKCHNAKSAKEGNRWEKNINKKF